MPRNYSFETDTIISLKHTYLFAIMLTIRQLAQRFSLSRATLLYYDKIGLLKPSHRNRAGYRLYDASSEARLKTICRYRASGLAIAQIGHLLGAEQNRIQEALKTRLVELQGEIAALRQQQQVIMALLDPQYTEYPRRLMTEQKWIELLTRVGLDDTGKKAWHQAFERLSPEGHQDFLESLGLTPAKIRSIRQLSGALSPEPNTSHSPRRQAPHERSSQRHKPTQQQSR